MYTNRHQKALGARPIHGRSGADWALHLCGRRRRSVWRSSDHSDHQGTTCSSSPDGWPDRSSGWFTMHIDNLRPPLSPPTLSLVLFPLQRSSLSFFFPSMRLFHSLFHFLSCPILFHFAFSPHTYFPRHISSEFPSYTISSLHDLKYLNRSTLPLSLYGIGQQNLQVLQ